LPSIASVARLYRESPRIERVELLQEGVVGLLRALERFDAARCPAQSRSVERLPSSSLQLWE
jgi:DNA-directed RNA polymerase specialized sigma subunit